VVSPYSKKRQSQHHHKVPTRSNKVRIHLGIIVTVSFCITAAHCCQSSNFSNGARNINTLNSAIKFCKNNYLQANLFYLWENPAWGGPLFIWWLRRPALGTEHSPRFSINIENVWNSTSTFTVRLHGMEFCCKERENVPLLTLQIH